MRILVSMVSIVAGAGSVAYSIAPLGRASGIITLSVGLCMALAGMIDEDARTREKARAEK